MSTAVKVWEEDIVLPTYEAGKPEKSPMFLERSEEHTSELQSQR